MSRLAGKVAFITGAGSGIARSAARIFTQEGAKVAIAELKPELGRETERLVRDAGGEAIFVETDVTKEESVQSAIHQTVARYARLDILYNCAGGSIAADTTVTEVDMSVWQHTQSLDLLGPFLCCRYGIPELVKAGGGAIVNMSSVVALQGSFPLHVYTAAKGGVIAFTQVLAGTYAKEKIRANVICPGVIMTDRVRQRLGVDRPQAAGQSGVVNLESQLKKYPFSVGEPEDVARVALFLASDEARMMTGAVVPVDGGLSAY